MKLSVFEKTSPLKGFGSCGHQLLFLFSYIYVYICVEQLYQIVIPKIKMVEFPVTIFVDRFLICHLPFYIPLSSFFIALFSFALYMYHFACFISHCSCPIVHFSFRVSYLIRTPVRYLLDTCGPQSDTCWILV